MALQLEGTNSTLKLIPIPVKPKADSRQPTAGGRQADPYLFDAATTSDRRRPPIAEYR